MGFCWVFLEEAFLRGDACLNFDFFLGGSGFGGRDFDTLDFFLDGSGFGGRGFDTFLGGSGFGRGEEMTFTSRRANGNVDCFMLKHKQQPTSWFMSKRYSGMRLELFWQYKIRNI